MQQYEYRQAARVSHSSPSIAVRTHPPLPCCRALLSMVDAAIITLFSCSTLFLLNGLEVGVSSSVSSTPNHLLRIADAVIMSFFSLVVRLCFS